MSCLCVSILSDIVSSLTVRSHPYVEGHMFVMKHQYEETVMYLFHV